MPKSRWNLVFALVLLPSLGQCYVPRTVPAPAALAPTTTGNATLDHPPIPTASWPPLPSNFSNISQPQLQCWNSHFSYSFTKDFLASEFYKSSTRIQTTFTPPRSGTSTYVYNATVNCSTTTFSPTTLCDNVPRASSRSVKCQTTESIGTVSSVEYVSDVTVITPTWTSEFAKPEPTCRVADDLSDECARLMEAWKWRVSRFREETALPSSSIRRLEREAIPPCTPLVSTWDPTKRPICKIAAATYSAYYWPTSTPSDFCQSSSAALNATVTTSAARTTAVVDGYTLTSPSVYHFLRNITVETYRGVARDPDDLGPPPWEVWGVYSTIPPDRTLTAAQLESDILTASVSCIGRELDLCSISFSPDFRVQDIKTVRKEAYDKNCRHCLSRDGGVVYQELYKPTMAVPISEVMSQNGGLFKECDWNLWDSSWEYHWQTYYESELPAVVVRDVPSSAFVPIKVTGAASVVGRDRQRRKAMPGERKMEMARATGAV